MTRRTHYIKLKLTDGKPSSVTWSPSRKNWGSEVPQLVDDLLKAMTSTVATGVADDQGETRPVE